MAEWKKVIVSGSVASLAAVSASTGIDVDGRVAATSFYGDGSNLTNVPAGSINIESFADGTGITVNAGVDKLILSDGGTEKQITVNQLFDSSDFDTEVAANSAVTANTAKNTNVPTNLSKTTAAAQITINSSDGDNVVIGEATGTIAGVMSTTHHNKLDGIESSADVTDATNVTAAGALMDSEVTSLDFIKSVTPAIISGSNVNTQLSNSQVKAAVEAASDSNTFTDADHSKLNGIEASATADQTNSEITTAVQASALNMGSNNITTTGKVLYSNMYSSEGDLPSASTYHGMFAHVHGTGAGYFAHGGNWIKLANNSQLASVGDGGLTTNDFTNADHSKLNAIEASADVTDATNVASAGAVMDSEVTSLDFIKSVTPAIISGSNVNTQLSNAQVKAAVEAATDSNTFTDADHSKLNGIEASATADQSAGDIRTLLGTGNGNLVPSAGSSGQFLKHDGTFGTPSYTTNTDTNTQLSQEQVQDFVGAMLGGTETGITVTYQDGTNDIDFVVASQTDQNFTNADHSKLDGIEASATADQTAIEIINLLNSDLGGNKQIGNQASDLMTFGGSVTVTGDLTVSGTTTTVDTANLNVTDTFINLNDGGGAADGGIVVEGQGTSFGWDESENRWAFDYSGATKNQTTITADAYASAVVTSDNSEYRKNGNIRVESNEIYIYVE